MANIKISELDDVVSLAGSEFVPVVQSLITKKTTVSAIAGLLGAATTVHVPISSAEILNMNSVPKVLVAAQGSGTIVMPLALLIVYTFVSVAYTTNTDLEYAPNTVFGDTLSGVLAFVASGFQHVNIGDHSVLTADAGVNTPINLFVQGGNPAAGNGTIDVYLTYVVITL